MILLSYLFISIYQILITYTQSCPDLCSPCLGEILNCDKQGLLEIPKLTNFFPLRAVFQNQHFSNSILTSSNFSSYRKVTELSIRQCNIIKIPSYTFSTLYNLRILDFSDNTDFLIENYAFSNLNLQYLKLDNLGIIKLEQNAFNGLKVNSLSIQNSNLLSLPFELMEPISKSLSKLFLKSNQLRTLDIQLRPMFLNLEILELQENPFICNCSVLWLSEILENKRHVTRDPTFEKQEELHPRCVSPPELRKEYVYTLVNRLKNCQPPSIVQIDVVFHSFESVGLVCNTKDTDNSNELTEIGWFTTSNDSSQMGPWKKSIIISLESSLTKYKCKAQNALGNSEIDLYLSWSDYKRNYFSVENNTFKFDEKSKNASFLWEKVFSLFEMICAIFGTLLITVILFFVFCCCYVERNHFLILNKNKRKLQAKGYPSYERGIYSDTRIYCETDMDVCPFPPPPPTPPPLSETRLIHNNFKTCKYENNKFQN